MESSLFLFDFGFRRVANIDDGGVAKHPDGYNKLFHNVYFIVFVKSWKRLKNNNKRNKAIRECRDL